MDMRPDPNTFAPKAWHIQHCYMAQVFKIDYVGQQIEISSPPEAESFIEINGFAGFEEVIILKPTGRLDASENMIYEGDIFDSIYKKDGCQGRYVVTYCEDRCIFFPLKVGKHQQENVGISMSDIARRSKIGNKFENPELTSFSIEKPKSI